MRRSSSSNPNPRETPLITTCLMRYSSVPASNNEPKHPVQGRPSAKVADTLSSSWRVLAKGIARQLAFSSGLPGSLRTRREDQRGSGARIAMLKAEEGGIAAAAPQQLVMPAAFDDLAAFDHQDGVGMHDG